ncbi:unnamed protein product [marine sediment metagenome]|uniref:Aminoglycoside phosphotransferase domain-containing protein n=1 Tax=marine sediment metagenome TaxID=412755 RepID=X1FFK2_9ZZZZ
MHECFPVIRSTLSAMALLSQVLPNYDIVAPDECKLFNIGLNDTYVVRTKDNKRYILRVYRACMRSLSDISYEMDILNHLNNKGVAVSVPLRRKDGRFVRSLAAPEGNRYVALFTYAQGKELTYNDESQAFQYGKAVAHVHAATEDFTSQYSRFPLDLRYLIDTPLKSIQPLLVHRMQDWDYLQKLANRLHELIKALPMSILEKGFCHGDFHGMNANITDEGIITFYDFDCGGPGWRAYDVAVFRWALRRFQEKENKL